MNKCRKNNSRFFKKLKVKIKKKREKYKKEKKIMKTPQNCRSPTQRQRFITAIKNVTEKKKKKLKSLIRFHSAKIIDNYNSGGGGE